MNIGVFDSGLGGLWILKALREEMPGYNYVFFGDQAHVPYGDKTVEELFTYTTEALRFLYEQKGCACVLLACNTTSSTLYGQLRAYVEKEFPGRLLFGIVRPTVLSTTVSGPIVVFATKRTVESHAYRDAFVQEKNSTPDMISEIVLPELATRIEQDRDTRDYIASFRSSVPTTTTIGILGCTHYGIVKDDFKYAFPHITTWVSQEEVIPPFFRNYLNTHQEFEMTLGKEGTLEVCVSAESHVFDTWLSKWFGSVRAILVEL